MSVPNIIDNKSIWDRYNQFCKRKWKTCNAVRWQSLWGSLQRLQTIQYVAKDIDIQKPSDLTNRIDQINNYKSSRDYPYLFAQYIGTSSKSNTNNTWLSQLTRDNTISIGEQGIAYSCDPEKIEKISKLDYKSFIEAIEKHDPTYRYPCHNGDLAHALAFNYYYYIKDTTKASLYYMVASFHDNTPLITLSMPAIIIGRDGHHKTSAFLRYDRLQSLYKALQEEINNDERKNIESTIDKSLKEMISEYSLYIINQAMSLAENNSRPLSCLYSLSCLQNNNYITQAFNKITKNCSSDPISCEIINLGRKNKRIYPSGVLIYPSDDTMIYSRDEKNNQWWIKKK